MELLMSLNNRARAARKARQRGAPAAIHIDAFSRMRIGIITEIHYQLGTFSVLHNMLVSRVKN